MKNIHYPLFTICLCFVLSACSSNDIKSEHTQNLNNIKIKAIETARQQIGIPYKFGGFTPDKGFDCSGLVFYSFQQAGHALPRTAYAQLKYSKAIPRRHLSPGDLVFFRLFRSRVSHVGIYLGDNRFIHAPSTGKSVGIARLNSDYWRKRFAGARRIY